MSTGNVCFLFFVEEPESVLSPVELCLYIVDPLALELVVVLVPVEYCLQLRQLPRVLLWNPLATTVIYMLWERQSYLQSINLVDRSDCPVLGDDDYVVLWVIAVLPRACLVTLGQ